MITTQADIHESIALMQIPNIGDVLAKQLVSYFGSAAEVLKLPKSKLEKVPGIGKIIAKDIAENKTEALLRAEKELAFIEKKGIEVLLFGQDNYPSRLRNCFDSPLVLYYKGNADLNTEKIVSVVGTRTPDDYGKEVTEALIVDLQNSGIMVVSGLAYGIDVLAHHKSLEVGLPTIGVLAHGLDRIYPGLHKTIAGKMIENGGLLTEFISETNPDAPNFPRRNRIVAGMCDALVVVQSKRSGGSLITATIANSYNKDVFAFPGKAGNEISEGCNGLIKKQRAVLIENAADLLQEMSWSAGNEIKKSNQVQLTVALTEEEQKIFDCFQKSTEINIDELVSLSGLSISKLAPVLLSLEMKNILNAKPGKKYGLV
ncbi:MAG: DNA-processing protein DprA [Bacteroidia bacterium]